MASFVKIGTLAAIILLIGVHKFMYIFPTLILWFECNSI